MERCPKCRGTLTNDWEQPSCINCGWVQYAEFEIAKSQREVTRKRVGRGGTRGNDPYRRIAS